MSHDGRRPRRRRVATLAILISVAAVFGCGAPSETPDLTTHPTTGPATQSPPVTVLHPSPSAARSASPAQSSEAPSALVPAASPVPIASEPALYATPEIPGTGALIVPPGTVQTLVLPLQVGKPGIRTDPIAPQPGGPPQGPFVYLGPEPRPGDTWTRAQHLFVVDVGGGSVREILVPHRTGEAMSLALVAGDRLIVLVWQHTAGQPAMSGMCWSDALEPLEWRLLDARLGTDGLPRGWRELDTGTSSRLFRDPLQMAAGCDEPELPLVQAAAGRVAYTADYPTAAYPAGTSIRIRSLATGSLERIVNTATQVIRLAFSDSSVAWTESPNVYAPGGPSRWRILRAPISTGLAQVVSLGRAGASLHFAPRGIALDGSVVYLSGFGNAVLRVDGESVTELTPGGTLWCDVASAAAGTALLVCDVEGRDAGLTVWTARSGLRTLVGAPTPLAATNVHVSDTQLAWTTYDWTGQWIGVTVVPIGALVHA